MKTITITKRFGQDANAPVKSFSIVLPETVKEAVEAYGEARVIHTIVEALKIDARSVFVSALKAEGAVEKTVIAAMATWKPSKEAGNRGKTKVEKLQAMAGKLSKAELAELLKQIS